MTFHSEISCVPASIRWYCTGLSVADESVQKFWSALSSAEILADKKVLSLVHDTYFLGSRYYGNKLYIRDCYHELLHAINNHYHNVSGQAVTLIGNPGISRCCMHLIIYNF